MTRFTQSILFFFAITLALLCSAVLMLVFNDIWNQAGFTTLVSAATVLSLVLPASISLASLRFIRSHQPITAWLIFYVINAAMILLLGNHLLK